MSGEHPLVQSLSSSRRTFQAPKAVRVSPWDDTLSVLRGTPHHNPFDPFDPFDSLDAHSLQRAEASLGVRGGANQQKRDVLRGISEGAEDEDGGKDEVEEEKEALGEGEREGKDDDDDDDEEETHGREGGSEVFASFDTLPDNCALYVFSFLTVPIHRAAAAMVSKRWFWLEKRSRKLLLALDLSCPSRALEKVPFHCFPALISLDLDCSLYQTTHGIHEAHQLQAREAQRLRQMMAEHKWERVLIVNSTFLLYPTDAVMTPNATSTSGRHHSISSLTASSSLDRGASFSSLLSSAAAPSPRGALLRSSPSKQLRRGYTSFKEDYVLFRSDAPNQTNSFSLSSRSMKGHSSSSGRLFGRCMDSLVSLDILIDPFQLSDYPATSNYVSEPTPVISARVFFQEVSLCTRLQRLVISQIVRGSSGFMERALACMPLLKYLDLGNMKITLPGVSDEFVEGHLFQGATDGMLKAIGASCPLLEEALIGPGATYEGLVALVSGCTHLRLLGDVSDTFEDPTRISAQWATNETFEELGYLCPSLRALRVQCCGDITDAGLIAFTSAESTSSLQKLALCTPPMQLSFHGVSHALTRLKSIGCLLLGFCEEEVEGHGFSSFVCALTEHNPLLNTLAFGVCIKREHLVISILLQSCPFLKSLYLFDPCSEEHADEEAELQDIASSLPNAPSLNVGYS